MNNKYNFTNKEWESFKETWKYFKIDNLFDVNEKGKISNSNNLEIGQDYYYIGAKKSENGYMKSISSNLAYDYLLTKGNCIAWIRQGQGSSGYSTYQNQDFFGASTLQILRNKNFNKNIYLFFVSILDLEFPKYNFGRALSVKSIKNTIIKLPIKRDIDGSSIILDKSKKYHPQGYIPDFEFMESYVENIFDKFFVLNEYKEKFKSTNKYKFTNEEWEGFKNEWEEFKLVDIFSFDKSSGIIISNYESDKGSIPIVSSTSENNGIKNFTNIKSNKIFVKNKITIAHNGSVGETFYQNLDFYKTSDITVIWNDDLNEYNAFFLIAIIKLNIVNKFSYGRKLNTERLNNLKIKLPIKKDQDKNPIINKLNNNHPQGYQPDFEFMESYVKNVNYSKFLKN